MLHLKRKGFALINTIIIISIITTLACFMFKLMRNNRDMSAIYYIDDDIFSVDSDEEELLYEFMKILTEKMANEEVAKSESNVNETENENSDFVEKTINEDIFNENFKEEYKQGKLVYKKDTDSLKLLVTGDYDALRVRELRYVIRENKAILIPTTNFIDTNTSYVYE